MTWHTLLPLKFAQDFHLFLPRFAAVGMVAQGKVEAGAAPQNSLRVRELAETPLAMVGAHARMARPIERNTFHHHVNAHLVDAAAAILLGLHGAFCPFYIFGK